MVATAFNTVTNSNGQQVFRTVKEKNTDFHAPAMERYVSALIDDQDGLCAITGIRLQLAQSPHRPKNGQVAERIGNALRG